MGSQQTITNLISDIRSRELILPEFQRGYVWNPTQVREYLQSLYRGYPTGSFLIWKTPNPGLVRGEGARDDKGSVFQLILDGQQRLTSVYTLIEGEPPPFYEGENLFFDIYFNVETEEFRRYSKIAMKDHHEWVGVTDFLKVGIGDFLKKDGPCPPEQRAFLFDYFDRLNKLDRIKSYTYYLDTLGEREMDEAVRIFNLVNKQGTPLDKAELALSHICAIWPGARSIFRAAAADLAAAGYTFDLSFLIRVLSAVATGSGRIEPIYAIKLDAIQDAWARARKSLEYLVNVLKTDGHMPSSGSLTSQNVVIPLVCFLSRNGSKFSSETQKKQFLHWMYNALIWARYTGPTETRLTQDIQALDGPEPTKVLLDNIIADRGRLKLEGSDLHGASWRTAFWSLAYVVALSRGAQDWVNGLPVHGNLLGKANVIEYHHIFPQSLLYAPTGPYNTALSKDQQRVNEIANLAFLTSVGNKEISNKKPAAYLPEVRSHFPHALSQQSVPLNPALWELDRYEEFLTERREMLASAINGFLDSLLVEGTPRGTTIEEYVAGGESDSVEFKGSLRWDWKEKRVNKELSKSVAKTIAGFMNGKGGTLVVGVSDDGQAWGIEADYQTFANHKDRDGWQQALVAILSAYLSGPTAALIDCTFSEFQGKTVAVIHADPWHKPVFLSDGGATEFYLRNGNTTQRLEGKELLAYTHERFAVSG